ncbi:MAG: alpha/beta hydrolase [Burkholderiaceae bacterium]
MLLPFGGLPFRSIDAASRNDPLCSIDRASRLARHLDRRFINPGAVGGLNPAVAYGEWHQAINLIA